MRLAGDLDLGAGLLRWPALVGVDAFFPFGVATFFSSVFSSGFCSDSSFLGVALPFGAAFFAGELPRFAGAFFLCAGDGVRVSLDVSFFEVEALRPRAVVGLLSSCFTSSSGSTSAAAAFLPRVAFACEPLLYMLISKLQIE